MNGAELTITLLERQGITQIAGIPGGANLPLYDALASSRKIRHILARHEQGAGFIAQGMARSTGKPAVCFATSGPGATNVLTAIADAKLDSIPVICITGQVPSGMVGSDAFQEVDTYGMTIPITKHNFQVRSAEELLDIIPDAFRIASSGRPGPVLIDIPKDVQLQQIELAELPEAGVEAVKPEFDIDDVKRAAELINSSERPILYVGGGVTNGEASESAIALSETGTIPAVSTLMGLGSFPSDHALFCGMLGMHAARYTNLALEETDLLIVAGARFDDRATGKVAEFCPDAKVIHIDIDRSELHKIRGAEVGIVGDISQVLEALVPMIHPRKRTVWRERIAELKREHKAPWENGVDHSSPYAVIKETALHAGSDAIVSTDVGQHQMWVAQAYPFMKPRTLLTSGGLGTMGFGLPTALGSALANRDKTCVCFTGDGSIMMNIQELATIAEEKANLKIILLNNNALGLVRQQQDLFFNRNYFASEFQHQVDFVTIARGFGIKTVDASEDMASAIAEAFSEDGPCLVHVPIERGEQVYPMVPPGAANKVMVGGE